MVNLTIEETIEQINLTVSEDGENVSISISEVVDEVNITIQDTGIAELENIPFEIDLAGLYQTAKL